jgi:hypothetical protein
VHDPIRRLISRMVRLLNPRPHASEQEIFTTPKPTTRTHVTASASRPMRREIAPLPGEASALVRPYLLAHEARERQRELRLTRVLLSHPHRTFAEAYE